MQLGEDPGIHDFQLFLAHPIGPSGRLAVVCFCQRLVCLPERLHGGLCLPSACVSPSDAVEEQRTCLGRGVEPSLVKCGAGKVKTRVFLSSVAELVGEASGYVCDQGTVARLPRRFDPDAVRTFSPRVLPGIAGDPTGDLGQFTDLGEKRAADCFRVGALAIQPHRGIEFAEHGGHQVAPGEHVVSEPKAVHAGGEARYVVPADAATCPCAEWR